MKRKEGSRKQDILFAAIRLMSEKGFDAVTMRMIAENVGCRTATLYSHYDSKEDILISIREFVVESFEGFHFTPGQVAQLLQTHSFADLLYRFVHPFEQIPRELRIQLYRLMYMELYHNQTIRDISYFLFISEPETHLENLLNILAEHSAIPPVDNRVQSFVWIRCFLMLGFWGTLFDSCQEAETFRDIANFFTGSIFHGVMPATVTSASFTSTYQKSLFQSDEGATTKEKLLAAAFHLIDRYGRDRVTIRMICDEVGIQAGSAYNHFKSKDEIVFSVMDSVFHQAQNFMLDEQELLQAFRSRDIDRIVLALSRCNPQLNDDNQRKSYRMIFRGQFTDSYFRDGYWNRLRSEITILGSALRELALEKTIPMCNSTMLATVYLYTMSAINATGTMFPESLENITAERQAAGEWILGMILYGS